MKFHRSSPMLYFHNIEAQIDLLDRVFIRNEVDETGFNRGMFNEDFSSIFHYYNRHSSGLFDISTNNQTLTKRLLASVDTRYGPNGSGETIQDWVNEIAESVIRSNKAYYHLWDDPVSENIKISSFGSSGVSTFLGVTLQWVPRHTERKWNQDEQEKPREVRLLDGLKILSFTMPKMLRRILRAQGRTLAVIDRHQFESANFYQQVTYEVPSPTNYFNFNAWRDKQDQALYRSTRQTGWNGRKYDGSKRSEFFDCHRLIRFRKNQLILRDHILRQIGSELTKVGQTYDAEYTVSIAASDALPQVDQLNDLELRLRHEEVSFTEVIDLCLKA